MHVLVHTVNSLGNFLIRPLLQQTPCVYTAAMHSRFDQTTHKFTQHRQFQLRHIILNVHCLSVTGNGYTTPRVHRFVADLRQHVRLNSFGEDCHVATTIPFQLLTKIVHLPNLGRVPFFHEIRPLAHTHLVWTEHFSRRHRPDVRLIFRRIEFVREISLLEIGNVHVEHFRQFFQRRC